MSPAHDKTYNKSCVTSKDSDQAVHNLVRAPSSLASPEAFEGTCDQEDLIRLRGCAD